MVKAAGTRKTSGSIRQKVVNGKLYWEGRISLGIDPVTGKQKSKSVSGKTKADVEAKMRAVQHEIDESGCYHEASKMTVSQWLDTWATEYCNHIKPRTLDSYKSVIEHHLKPSFGKIKLSELTPVNIQSAYNRMKNVKTGEPLTAKALKNCHGVLHMALQVAVDNELIRRNPADKAKLPKVRQTEIKPLNDEDVRNFLTAIVGTEYERVYMVTLFTGLREGEVLGLTWDEIDYKKGTITIKHQLQKRRGSGGEYSLVSTKNGKSRTITPAPFVIELLKTQERIQKRMQAKTADWSNPMGLVFTHDDGRNLCAQTVYLCFKKIAKEIGCPDARFHDLRHTYATLSLKNGDSVKTVQETLGHHTAAFTMQTYLHVTEEMKKDSADRMQNYISSLKTGIA